MRRDKVPLDQYHIYSKIVADDAVYLAKVHHDSKAVDVSDDNQIKVSLFQGGLIDRMLTFALQAHICKRTFDEKAWRNSQDECGLKDSSSAFQVGSAPSTNVFTLDVTFFVHASAGSWVLREGTFSKELEEAEAALTEKIKQFRESIRLGESAGSHMENPVLHYMQHTTDGHREACHLADIHRDSHSFGLREPDVRFDAQLHQGAFVERILNNMQQNDGYRTECDGKALQEFRSYLRSYRSGGSEGPEGLVAQNELSRSLAGAG